MSLNSILSIAQTGLSAAQTGITVVSDNVTNINTTGYVRKVVDQSSSTISGVGTGVTVDQIRTTADVFLEQTSRAAASDSGAANIESDILGQAQALLGDPSTASTSSTNTYPTTTFASSLNALYAGFISLSATPGAAAQNGAVSGVQSFLDQAGQVSAGLDALSKQVDTQTASDVTQINNLLAQASTLNAQISRATVSAADASGAQDQQSQVIDQLSSLLSISVNHQANGAVTIRSDDGALLVNGADASTVGLVHNTSGSTVSLQVTSQNGVSQAIRSPGSGEVSGLLTLRNGQLPGIKSQLAELVSETATQLNAAHNAHSAVPPPQTLNGRNTGTDEATALSGFTGKTTISITDATGNSQVAAAIDFDAGTITTSSGSVTSFAPGSFDAGLSAALGGYGSASFSNGALSISAAPTYGVVISDGGSSKAGQNFSSFLGLNDLLTSSSITNYNTGLTASSSSGFTAGGTLSLDLSGTGGNPSTTVNLTTAAGDTIGSLLTQLNAATGGVGLYGSFTLDSNGALAFTPNAAANALGVKLSVAGDTTSWGAGGASFTTLFGVGDKTRSQRLNAFQVRNDITTDASKLALASYDPSGIPPLAKSDTGGADALAQSANNTSAVFAAAGVTPKTQTSVTVYAATITASIANQAANATAQTKAADSIKNEADTRRSATEGVNLDQELVSLTTYQQAYSASARLIQASQNMFTALIGILN